MSKARELLSIAEKVYSVDIEQVDTIGNPNKGHFILDSIVLILSKSPEEWIKNPDSKSISALIIPGYQTHSIHLRAMHYYDNNQGAIRLKSRNKVKLVMPVMELDAPNVFMPGVLSINDEKKDPGEMAKLLLKYFENYKVIVDHKKDKIGELPKVVQNFVDKYILYGEIKKSGSGKSWKKVKEWYQDLPKGLRKSIPGQVYRGVGEDKEIESTYKHPYSYPISTSTSKKIARDYGKYVKLKIKPEDVVLDTRIIITEHPAQSEILLDPTKEYEVID